MSAASHLLVPATNGRLLGWSGGDGCVGRGRCAGCGCHTRCSISDVAGDDDGDQAAVRSGELRGGMEEKIDVGGLQCNQRGS